MKHNQHLNPINNPKTIFMSKTGRDDFSKPIVDALAKRAGYRCSNPDCRKETIGASDVAGKSATIGEAAHITAAAAGGKRYNAEMASEQRSDISNGIWLCSNCATLIDKDEAQFTVPLLHEWKGGVEIESKMKLRGKAVESAPEHRPVLEVDFAGQGRGRWNTGYSVKNPIEEHDGVMVMVPGNAPIIHWGLNWRYDLVIYNNSNYPAYNVKVENVSDLHFTEFGQLPKINNIPPLATKALGIKFEDMIESSYKEADALQVPRYPTVFNDRLVLRITYQDEKRNSHSTMVSFHDGEIINTLN